MTARPINTTTRSEQSDIWAQLAAPIPVGDIQWRQDGRAIQRDGKYLARFVAYIEANTVRERLDSTVPGEWDLTLESLPALASDEGDEMVCSFKARVSILGVIREDVGNGRDYKQASTDAFKRACVRFGIGHELYEYEQNWVQVDGDGKYAKPVEDPGEAYARRQGKGIGSRPALVENEPADFDNALTADSARRSPSDTPQLNEPSCPKCGGRMWDNRISKRNPKQPDFKCKSRACDGVIWPPRAPRSEPAPGEINTGNDRVSPLDELPF